VRRSLLHLLAAASLHAESDPLVDQMEQLTCQIEQVTHRVAALAAQQQDQLSQNRLQLEQADQEVAQLCHTLEIHSQWRQAALQQMQSIASETRCDAQTALCLAQEPSWSCWLRQHSNTEVAGIYGRRHLHESGYITPPVEDQPVPFVPIQAPDANRGKGNWAGAFLSYELVAPKAIYFGLRGSWGAGKLHPHENVGIWPFAPPDGTIPAPQFFSQTAHEWDVEGRLGYTFESSCNSLFSLFLGAGYHGFEFNLIGRAKATWFRIPIGLRWEWNPSPIWSLGLDGTFGLMADGRFIAWDTPQPSHPTERPFDNRYQWSLELPIGCNFTDCSPVRLELIPFWQGWKTGEKWILEGIATLPSADPEPRNAFLDSLAAPALISSMLGLRVALEFHF
jgi:hypothetical protein